jgi:hypothetical protein
VAGGGGGMSQASVQFFGFFFEGDKN